MSEVVSCMAIGDRPYLVATTNDGKVFIGYVRTGDRPDVKWTRCTDIPIDESTK